MALTQVRVKLGSTWTTLTYNASTGRYEGYLTSTTPSTGQPGGYYSLTVEAANATGQTATVSGDTMPGLRLVVEDKTAPVLIVTSPANNLVTAAASVTVSGTASDSSGLSSLTVNGTAVTVAEDGTFSTSVSLSAGTNVITITATDTSGNTTTETRSVARATSGPSLTVTSPTEGAVVNTASVSVTGAVSDSVAGVKAVSVNGVTAAISGGSYTALVPLSEGGNTITVTAENHVGLKTTRSVSVTRDMTGPSLTVTAPEDGLVTAAEQVTVTGSVTDAEGVRSVTVNGNPVTVSGGAFSAVVPLTVGGNTITVEATDTAGNASTVTRSVTRATVGPETEITSPVDGAILNSRSVTVTGTVSDAFSPVAGVTVNGTAATVSDGGFAAGVTLDEGANTITVVSVNQVGLSTTVTVSVTVDTISPQITLTAPVPGQMVTGAAFTVTGAVSDSGPGVAGVTVNGQAAALSADGTFSLGITLQEGVNPVTATVTDRAGNTGTATGSVLLDTIPPELSVTSPAVGLMVNNPQLTVSGTASDSGSGLAAVTVNGAAARMDGSAFSLEITLREGNNAVTVTASDLADNQTTVTRTVLLDTREPVLRLVSPAEGLTRDNLPTVVFAASDEPGGSGVDMGTVSVTLDGAAQTAGVAIDGLTVSFTPPAALEDGPHVVTVTVEDNVGNRRGLSAVYTVDTVPPWLVLRRPYRRHVFDAAEIEIAAEAGDVNGVASVTVGGVGAAGGGVYTRTVPLEVGENHIVITATDNAGNQTSETLYAIRLITDRRLADAERVRGLLARPASDWTAKELAWFNGAIIRGAYNDADLNRVGIALRHLAMELENHGYAPGVQPKTDWTREDVPTVTSMNTYLRNVYAIRDAQGLWYLTNNPLPASMAKLDTEGANQIEKALVETDSVFPRYSAWTAGEISCGGF